MAANRRSAAAMDLKWKRRDREVAGKARRLSSGPISRTAELAAISNFIASNGVTALPAVAPDKPEGNAVATPERPAPMPAWRD